MPYLRYETPFGARWYDLAGRDQVVIGRSKECDIVLQDGAASRRHCVVRKVAGGFVLVDLGSKNGTLVNGMPSSNWNLKDGDLIAVGSTKITFRLQK